MDDDLKVIVLVDNDQYIGGLEKRWGLSIYLKFRNKSFLFDTSSDPISLMKNSIALGVNLRNLDAVVISHKHSDHIGGLKFVSRLKPGLRVYVPFHSGINDYLKRMGLRVIPVDKTMSIGDDVFVVGELKGGVELYEIALAIKINGKLFIFVGCSHPGVDKIVDKAVKDINGVPYLVMGGFHSPSKITLDYLIKTIQWKIIPLHCSGFNTINYLKEKAPNKLIIGGSGFSLYYR